MRSTVRPLRRTLLRLLPIATLAAAGIAFSAPASAADELVVSAAASLTNAFKAVGDAYEKQHPETKVLFNFGASDVLMQQIARRAGRRVRVGRPEGDGSRGGRKGDRARHASRFRGELARADRAGGQQGRRADGAERPDRARREAHRVRRPGIGAGRPPRKRAARGRRVDAVSAKGVLAANVRQSLDYVARGEVDAGFVFGTDAAIMPGRVKVALTVPTKTAITYPIAVVRTAATPRRRSRSSTSSRRRRAVLSTFGFKPAGK